MEKLKVIKKIIKAERVNMGGILLDQALPAGGYENIDPFLLIHHWSSYIKGGQKQEDLGVGPHPHRGFSPVTLVFDGGVHHRDSLGNSSKVKKGGTQWMNSGSGIVHSERPVKELAENGGNFELIQFWINSPSELKMINPSYQEINTTDTPYVPLGTSHSQISIVGGELLGVKGPAKTLTPMLVLRLHLKEGEVFTIPVEEGFNALIYILNGNLKINKKEMAGDKELINFDNSGNSINIKVLSETRAILLAGEPIREEIYSYGPFVMNSEAEIIKALDDYQSGNMGILNEIF